MNDDLRILGDEYWQYRLSVEPTNALMLGIHDYDDQVEDASRPAEDGRIARLRDFARRARAIDPTGLSEDDRISREVLVFETSTGADLAETHQAEMDVNHAVGIQATLPVIISQLPIDESEHAEAVVAKYEKMSAWFDQMAQRLRQGVAAGRTPMESTVRKTVAQIDAHLAAPLENDFFLTLRTPASFDEDAAAAWKQRLATVVADQIRPAYRRYRDVIADEVLPASRSDDHPGLSWLPDGESTYARAIHLHTSLPLAAEEIHQIGLRQIDRLADEYRALGVEALGTSDLPEIFSRLRDDADLHFTDGAEIVAASEVALAKAKAAMGNWFGRLPQADCLVAETPTGPTAFYYPPAVDGSRPGTFFVNTADPAGWGRFEIESMAYHEGIPGHHLQLSISQELEGVPEFRKHARITAYAEGWALYTERLADEMGLYSGPLERMGMLSADSMRAGRLVVDTGLHAKGWSRQQAIDYFAANSPMSLSSIEEEIDRYIGLPGQALSYMIGRLEIMQLRADAEAALGDRFDIKGFHDTVLGSGWVPLETLAGMVRRWAGRFG